MDSKSKYEPVIPLPNPGEGGPVVAPGDQGETGMPGMPGMPGMNRPIIPLPNPGEGGPVGPNGPMIPGPNRPTIPLPNPGEGGPVGPNRPNVSVIPGIIGTIITTYPRPNAPCKFCNNSEKYGTVRFMNAANDYNPFAVYVNENLFVNPLNFAEVTEYEKVASGYQVVTVMGDNGYIFVQKPVMIPENGMLTIAIINTDSGLDLAVIPDVACKRPYYISCIRVCNLAYSSGELNVVIGDQYVTFMNVVYKEVTDYKSIWPGDYSYYVSRSVNNQFMNNKQSTVVVSSSITTQANVNYTMYLLNWNKSQPESVKVLIVEER